MADINVTVTVPAVITATATDPNTVTVAVTNPAPITVSASVGNSGDMTKAVYDTDNDGVVDNAEALGGVAATSYALSANVPANVDPSVADNFVSFSNTTGAQKDSGKGLTHLVYTLQAGTGANFNPADGTNYRIGAAWSGGINVANGIFIPMAGTIITLDFTVMVFTILGSTETSTVVLLKNGVSAATISSDVQANTANQHYRANVSIAVAQDDYIEWRWTAPTWATNPTGVRLMGIAMIQV